MRGTEKMLQESGYGKYGYNWEKTQKYKKNKMK